MRVSQRKYCMSRNAAAPPALLKAFRKEER